MQHLVMNAHECASVSQGRMRLTLRRVTLKVIMQHAIDQSKKRHYCQL